MGGSELSRNSNRKKTRGSHPKHYLGEKLIICRPDRRNSEEHSEEQTV